jgi:hypothetical protein
MSHTTYKTAAYYFPNYHVDAMNEEAMGAGWTEWELLKKSSIRYPNHKPQAFPTWGFFDEADPAFMRRQVDEASRIGIDAFLFDWYWFKDQPFLSRPLDEAFIQHGAGEKMEFALMWANMHWYDIFPAGNVSFDKQRVIFENEPSTKIWDAMTDHIASNYFTQPNYLCIDGRPFFFIFDLQNFIEGFESLEKASEALRKFDDKARAVGHQGVHYSFRASQKIALASSWSLSLSQKEVAARLGISSVGDYGWEFENPMDGNFFPEYPTEKWADANMASWASKASELELPYSPCVQVGWDSTSRCVQGQDFEPIGYPWWPVVADNGAVTLQRSLEAAKKFAEEHKSPLITINAWNEWTEGSVLLPCERHGDSRFNAVKNVFAK